MIAGNWQFDQGVANGNLRVFNTTTDAGGRYTATDGRVPAFWQFHRGPVSPCPTIAFNLNVTPGLGIETGCILVTQDALVSSPDPVNSQATPQPFQISGAGIDTTYGMPKVEYFDDWGNLVGDTVATDVTGDTGYSVMSGMMPNLTSLYDDNYTLLISNASADGFEAVGTTTVQTYGNPEPPPDPGGGGGGGDCQPGRMMPIIICGAELPTQGSRKR